MMLIFKSTSKEKEKRTEMAVKLERHHVRMFTAAAAAAAAAAAGHKVK
jgi:hypothetical protein